MHTENVILSIPNIPSVVVWAVGEGFNRLAEPNGIREKGSTRLPQHGFPRVSAWPACEARSLGWQLRSKTRSASRRAGVPVMQPADVREGDHAALTRWFDLTRDRRVAVERQVASRLVVVREVRGQDPQQVRFVEHDHVVQAFAANRADESLHVRVLPGRAVRDDDFLDAQVLEAFAEVLPVNA